MDFRKATKQQWGLVGLVALALLLVGGWIYLNQPNSSTNSYLNAGVRSNQLIDGVQYNVTGSTVAWGGSQFSNIDNVSKWIFNDSNTIVNVSMFALGSPFAANAVQFQSALLSPSQFEWNGTYNFSNLATFNATMNLLAGGNMTIQYVTSSPITVLAPGVFEVLGGNTACGTLTLNGLGCGNYDIFDTSNFTAAMLGYNLTVTDYLTNYTNSSGTIFYVYSVVVTGYNKATTTYSLDGVNPVFFFDPSITYFGFGNSLSGVGNLTYINGTSAVQTLYYGNNYSFSPNGTFFSGGIVLNATASGVSAPDQIANFTWAWFEDGGIQGANDSPLLDLNFENNTKDDSPYNQSINHAPNTYNNTANCVSGQCLWLSDNTYANWTNAWPSMIGNGTNGFTVSVWINSSSISQVTPQYLFSNQQIGTATSDGFYLAFNSSGAALFYVSNGTGSPNEGANLSAISLPNTIKSGQWYQLVGVANYANNSASLYINGSLIATEKIVSPFIQSTCSIEIGDRQASDSGANGGACGSNGNSKGLVGSMDIAEYWNRTLSSAEVKELYNWQLGPNPSQENWVNNFTNVSIAVRGLNYSFNDSGLENWYRAGQSTDNDTGINATVDLSGNGYNGYFANSNELPLVDSTGPFGNGLNFNVSTNITFPTTTTEYLNNMTILAWVRDPVQSASTTYQTIAQKGNGATTRNYWFEIDGGGVCATKFAAAARVPNSGGTDYTVCGTSAIDDGNLHLIGFTWNGTGLNLYQDGAVVATTPVTGIPDNSNQPLIVGSYTAGPWFFNGSIYELLFFNRSLSTAEISAIYNSGNPTGSGGEESNWSAWSPDYSNGFAKTNVLGNLVQFRANLTSVSTNYSAFLENVTLNFNPPSSGGNTFFPVWVNLISPANDSNVSGVPQDSGKVNLTYFANSSDGTFINATLWADFNGTWSANQTNQSAVINGSLGINFFNVTGITNGAHFWNVLVCNGEGNCTFAPQNYTLVVDKVGPIPAIQITPTNGSYQTNLLVNFSFIPADLITGAANTTLWIFNSTGFQTNSSINTTVTNGSQVVNLINLPRVGTYNWTVTTCDFANNCVNTSFGNFVADNLPPDATIQVSPLNNTNQSSSIVNFSYIPQDPLLSFSTVTLFVFNATGFPVNTTVNSTVANNTLVTNLISFPNNGVYYWTVQACDLALLCVNNTFGNFTIDSVKPLAAIQVSPLNNSQTTNFLVNFSFIPQDALTGAANTTLYVENGTGFIVNTSLNASVTNGSQVVNLILLTRPGLYNWTVTTCDWANNCVNTSFGNFNLAYTLNWTNFVANTTNLFLSQPFTLNATWNTTPSIFNLSQYWLMSNATGSFANSNQNSFTNAYNFSPLTLIAPNTQGTYWYQVCANDTYGDVNCTSYIQVTVNNPTVTIGSVAWNNTSVGTLTQFSAVVSDSVSLVNATLELNPGNGITTNYTVSISGTSVTVLVNETINTLVNSSVVLNWFACDSAGICGESGVYTFNTTGPTPIWANFVANATTLTPSSAFTLNATWFMNLTGSINRLSEYWVMDNSTGTFKNESFTLFSGIINFSNATLVAPASLGVYYYEIWANDTGTNQNVTGFIQITVVNGIAPLVQLIVPSNGAIVYSPSIASGYNITVNSNWVNATLYDNYSGQWQVAEYNTTPIQFGLINWFDQALVQGQAVIWNVQVCNATSCYFAPSNYSVTEGSVSPVSVVFQQPQTDFWGILAILLVLFVYLIVLKRNKEVDGNVT